MRCSGHAYSTFSESLTPHYPQWPLVVSSRGVARILLEHAGEEGAALLPNGALLRVTVAEAHDGVGFRVEGIDYLDPARDVS